MTTIAYRDGVLAADTRLNWDNTYATPTTKLIRLKDGSWLATAGSMVEGEKLRKWYEKGANEQRYPKFKDMHAILLKPSGQVWMFDDDGGFQLEEKADLTMALGSGAVGALCAMKMGADAKTAVGVVAEYDMATAKPVQFVTVASKEPEKAE